MARSAGATVAKQKRTSIRNEHWASETRWWSGYEEKGWFAAPRSLPFVLRALDSKLVSGAKRVSPAYIDLLSRHMDEGVVELEHDTDHAYAAGYAHARQWRERMVCLERVGFIKTISKGPRKYATAFLVHPALAMMGLRNAGKIPEELWNAYRACQIHAREPLAEDILKALKSEAESSDDDLF